MVEIFTLGWFTNLIGEMVQSKGYRAGHFRFTALLLWCAGEISGLFIGLTVAPKGDLPSLLLIYLCALSGAAVGAVFAYLLARNLKSERTQTI